MLRLCCLATLSLGFTLPSALAAQSAIEVSSFNSLKLFASNSAPGTVIQITASQLTATSSLTIDRGVTILGAPGTGTQITALTTVLLIHDLPADQELVLRDLESFGSTEFPAGANWGWDCVRVDDCAGAVVFENCHFRGLRGSNGLLARNSPRILANDSSFEGGRGFLIDVSLGGPAVDWGGNGLYLEQSAAWLQNSIAIGGDGLTGGISTGSSSILAYSTNPGQGAFLDHSSLQAVVSHFGGGLGAPGGAAVLAGVPGPCMALPSDGGSAVDILQSSSARLDGCTFGPGAGLASPCSSDVGADGLEVAGANQPGSTLVQTDRVYGMHATNPVVDASAATIAPVAFELNGEPGSFGFLVVSAGIGAPLTVSQGFDLLLDPAGWWIGLLGTASPLGVVGFSAPSPALQVGAVPIRIFAQGALVDANTGVPVVTVLPAVSTTIVP